MPARISGMCRMDGLYMRTAPSLAACHAINVTVKWRQIKNYGLFPESALAQRLDDRNDNEVKIGIRNYLTAIHLRDDPKSST